VPETQWANDARREVFIETTHCEIQAAYIELVSINPSNEFMHISENSSHHDLGLDEDTDFLDLSERDVLVREQFEFKQYQFAYPNGTSIEKNEIVLHRTFSSGGLSTYSVQRIMETPNRIVLF
jgi:hypothetical protein